MQNMKKLAISSLPTLILCTHPALAYIGPGMGAGTLGVIVGLLGSILLALFAFFWYPIKRAFKGKDKKPAAEVTVEATEQVQVEKANTKDA